MVGRRRTERDPGITSSGEVEPKVVRIRPESWKSIGTEALDPGIYEIGNETTPVAAPRAGRDGVVIELDGDGYKIFISISKRGGLMVLVVPDEAGSDLKVQMIQFVVITVETRTKKKGKWEKDSSVSRKGRMSYLPSDGAKFDGKTTYVDSTKPSGGYPHFELKTRPGKRPAFVGEDFPRLSKKEDKKVARGIRKQINRRRRAAGKKPAIQIKITFDFTLFVFVNDVIVAVIVWQVIMFYPPPSQLERKRRREEKEKAKKEKKLPTPNFGFIDGVWYEIRVKSIGRGRPWTESQAGAMKKYVNKKKNGYP